MNYREFTERVYNYKHGLTNSAESQNIQHSSDESIEHSSKGDSWDQHKYIRKEYLGNGNWKYIYEDGSSHVSTGANEKEADAREDADYIKRTTPNVSQAQQGREAAANQSANNAKYGPGLKQAQQGREFASEKSIYNAKNPDVNEAQKGRDLDALKSQRNAAYGPGLKQAQQGRQADIFSVPGNKGVRNQLNEERLKDAQQGRAEAINNAPSNAAVPKEDTNLSFWSKVKADLENYENKEAINWDNPYDPYLRSLGYDPTNITGAEILKAFPSSYNPDIKDEEHYALQDDQTFKLISNEPAVEPEPEPEQSSIDPNTWYDSATGKFVTGTSEADDNDFYKSFRESFYQTTLNSLKNNKLYTDMYTEKELEDLARKYTNSFVENMKISNNSKNAEGSNLSDADKTAYEEQKKNETISKVDSAVSGFMNSKEGNTIASIVRQASSNGYFKPEDIRKYVESNPKLLSSWQASIKGLSDLEDSMTFVDEKNRFNELIDQYIFQWIKEGRK